MIYDQVEELYITLNANFAADYTALLAAKGVASPGTLKLIMRQRAEIARKFGELSPFLGIYSIAARTQAKDQMKRDTEGACAVDAFISGGDPELIARQVELAAEAVLKTVDRMASAASGVHWAGELQGSIAIEFADAYEEAEEGTYWRTGTVTFPMRDRDEPL